MPGLLVVLPILVPLVSVYGPRHVILTTVLGLLSACGAIYALASIARGMGKAVEEKLLRQWGGMPTTLALRHSNTYFDRLSKARYHAQIQSKLGVRLPTQEEETQNPDAADQFYTGVTRQLRELTRKDRTFLLAENIAYGFHRNMLGMRPLGVLSSSLGLFYGLLISNVLAVDPIAFALLRLSDPGLAGGLTLAISASLLIAWLGYFREPAVRRMAWVYTDHLFEALGKLPIARRKNEALSNACKG